MSTLAAGSAPPGGSRGAAGDSELSDAIDAIPDPRHLLRRFGIRPRKRLGQHFLADRRYLAAILAASELEPGDRVLEIGPGLGVLTGAMAGQAGRVVAVEIDAGMVTVLGEILAGFRNVSLVHADILSARPADLIGLGPEHVGRILGYKVVANLPYYITSAVLRHVLASESRPERAVLMVQREVADRMVAKPGRMSLLAVGVQYYAAAERVALVPARAFYPAPKVDSAIVRLDVHASSPVGLDGADTAAYFRVVRAGFAQKRKQLKNSLAAGLALTAGQASAALNRAGVDPRRRAETLSLGEWANVLRAIGPDAGTLRDADC